MSHPFSAPSIQTGITQKYSSFIKTHVIFQNLQKYIIFERQNRKLLFPGCWIPTVTLIICPEQIKAVRALSDTVSFQYLMKKLGSIKSFSGRSLKTWNQCSHPAQIHKTLQISLSVNSQHLPICQLKPEVLNSSKILSSRSWNCCWGSETHCTHFRWEYRKVKKCFISNKGQFFFSLVHKEAPECTIVCGIHHRRVQNDAQGVMPTAYEVVIYSNWKKPKCCYRSSWPLTTVIEVTEDLRKSYTYCNYTRQDFF